MKKIRIIQVIYCSYTRRNQGILIMDRIKTIEETKIQLCKEIGERFKAKIYKPISEEFLADISLSVKGGKINLDISVPNMDDICYIQFYYYWNASDGESILTVLYQTCIIFESLFEIRRDLPRIAISQGKDRKGNEDICINLDYKIENYNSESILYVLEAFNKIDLRKKTINKFFIKNNCEKLYELLISKSRQAKEKFIEILGYNLHRKMYCENITVFSPIISSIFSKNDYVYSDYRQKIYVGFTQEGIDNYIEEFQLEPQEFTEYYEGVHYNIVASSNNTFVLEKRLWKEAWNWLYTMEMNYGEVPVYQAYSKGRIILRVVEFWICIMSEVDIKNKIISERLYLQDMQKKYFEYTSNEITELEYDLFELSPGKFEEMCYDLLCADGYHNIQRRGSLNAADGGIDIEAVEIVKGIVQEEKRKWIFQCKSGKKNLSRKDLNEIPFLLKEFKADRYGLFLTGSLTPNALNRCETFGESTPYILDKDVIKQKLREHNNIANKYFPLHGITIKYK